MWVFPSTGPDGTQASLKISTYSNARGGPSKLIEPQVVRSKSELLKELPRILIARAVVYRNVDRRVWDQIAKEHGEVRLVLVTLK